MYFADPTVTPVATQVTISAIVVALLQWLKQSPWFPWLTTESEKLNRVIAAMLAAFTAIGIHIAWNHGAAPGTYMVEVSGLTLMGVLSGMWAWAKSFVFQQIIFRATVKPAPLKTPATAEKVAQAQAAPLAK